MTRHWKAAMLLIVLLVFPTGFARAQTMAPHIDLEDQVPNALSMRIPNSGFDFVNNLASTLIDVINVNALIMAMNPIADDCYTIASAEVNITSANIGDITVDAGVTPVMGLGTYPNDLYLRITVPKSVGANNILGINVSGDFICLGPGYSASATVDVSSIEIGAAVGFDNPPSGLEVVVDDLVINLNDFGFDISNFPDSLEDWFSDLIEDIVSDFASDFAEEFIQDLVDEELSDIAIEGTSSFGSETLYYSFDPALFTDAGGATFFSGAHLHLLGDTVEPCVDPGSPIGSKFTDNPFGSWGATTPTGNTYQLGIALSDDLFNQLLYSVFVRGLLCWGPDGLSDDKALTGRDFENYLPKDLPEEIIPIIDLPWVFQIYPASIPVIEIGQGGNDLSLIIDDMRVDWLVKKDGRYVELANASFDLDMGLDIDMDQDGNLVVTFNNPTINLDIHSSSFSLLSHTDLQSILQPAINIVLQMLGNLIPPIPLPGFAGFSLVIQELGPVGTFEDYLGIFVEVQHVKSARDEGIPETQFVLEDSPGNNVYSDFFDLDPGQSADFGLKDGRDITIQLKSTGSLSPVEKYLFNLDGNGWILLKGDQLHLPELLEGPHELLVKAKNELNVVDETPAVLRFVCDNVAPHIDWAAQVGNRLEVSAWDYIDTELTYMFKVEGLSKGWSLEVPNFNLSRLESGVHEILITASDRAGNISDPFIIDVSIEDEGNGGMSDADDEQDSRSANDDADESTGGCSTGGERGPTLPMVMLVVALLSLLLRRLPVAVKAGK